MKWIDLACVLGVEPAASAYGFEVGCQDVIYFIYKIDKQHRPTV